MIGDGPLLGVGPGNWPIVFPRYAEPGAAEDGVLSASLAPRQAHNDLLERTAETGFVGLAALLIFATAVAVATRRRLRAGEAEERPATAAAAGALVALVATGITGFPLEMPGTLALGGVALGLATAIGRPIGAAAATAPATRSARLVARAAVVVAAALVAGAGLRADRALRGSHGLGQAERLLRRDRAPEAATRALAALERAGSATPGAFRVRLRAAQALQRTGRFGEAAGAAKAALAIEPYSPNAWAALAGAELGAGEVKAARTSAERALSLLNDHPYALFVQARAAEAIGDEPAADAAWHRLGALAAGGRPHDDATAADARDLLAARPPAKGPSPAR
jgi:tetratricopeptide (TPR) repeat protein